MSFREKNLWHFLPLQEPGKGRADREEDREKAETGEREKDPNARYYSERSDRPCCRPAPGRERLIRSFRKLQKYATFLSFREPVQSWKNKVKYNAAKEKKQRCENFRSVKGGSVCTPVSEKRRFNSFPGYRWEASTKDIFLAHVREEVESWE